MGFDGAAKKDGKNLILNYLKNSGADILCLQEYSTRTILKASYAKRRGTGTQGISIPPHQDSG